MFTFDFFENPKNGKHRRHGEIQRSEQQQCEHHVAVSLVFVQKGRRATRMSAKPEVRSQTYYERFGGLNNSNTNNMLSSSSSSEISDQRQES